VLFLILFLTTSTPPLLTQYASISESVTVSILLSLPLSHLSHLLQLQLLAAEVLVLVVDAVTKLVIKQIIGGEKDDDDDDDDEIVLSTTLLIIPNELLLPLF